MHECSLKKATQARSPTARSKVWGVRPPSIDGPRARNLSTPDPVSARLAFASQRGHVALMDVKGVGHKHGGGSKLDLGLCKRATRSHGAFEGFVGAGIGVKRFDRRGTRLFGVVEGGVAWPLAT